MPTVLLSEEQNNNHSQNSMFLAPVFIFQTVGQCTLGNVDGELSSGRGIIVGFSLPFVTKLFCYKLVKRKEKKKHTHTPNLQNISGLCMDRSSPARGSAVIFTEKPTQGGSPSRRHLPN